MIDHTDLGITMREVALNDLAFRSLNNVPHIPPESDAEAIDSLSHWVRCGSLAIAVALFEIADAIKDASSSEA